MINLNALQIGKYFTPFRGGIENVTYDLMAEQSFAMNKVSAIVHHHERHLEYAKELTESGCIYKVPILGVVAFVPIAPAFPRYFTRALRDDSPDVLHMHMPNVSCFWALFSKKARGIPWVIHWHSDVLGAAPDWRIKLLYPVYRLFEKALLKKASAVIVTSPAYLQTSELLSQFKHKCHVIPLGISALHDYDMQDEPIKKGESDSNLDILCIGRLTYYKGHQYLLNALSKLREQGRRVSLTIVGKGELESDLHQQVKELNLAEQVTFAGGVSDEELNSLLNQCDLLCLPSIERTEAFGVVLLEAMRASKPCLVTDVPGSGMNWVVQDNVTGLVAKAGDVHSLAEKLNYACEHKSKLIEMGKAGRRRFEQHFNIAQVAAQINVLYEQVIAEHKYEGKRKS